MRDWNVEVANIEDGGPVNSKPTGYPIPTLQTCVAFSRSTRAMCDSHRNVAGLSGMGADGLPMISAPSW